MKRSRPLALSQRLPGERVRYTDKFEDPNLPGDIQVTVTLKPVSVGTELSIVQEGVHGRLRRAMSA